MDDLIALLIGERPEDDMSDIEVRYHLQGVTLVGFPCGREEELTYDEWTARIAGADTAHAVALERERATTFAAARIRASVHGLDHTKTYRVSEMKALIYNVAEQMAEQLRNGDHWKVGD
jgi:hypothetical protein